MRLGSGNEMISKYSKSSHHARKYSVFMKEGAMENIRVIPVKTIIQVVKEVYDIQMLQ